MYLLELTFHTVKVVWLTFFVYGFPFLLECFANWTEFFLLSLLRNLCQGCRYIGTVVVFLCFFSSFCISVVWSVFIGRTRVFSKFIVALLSFSKKSVTGSIDFCSVSRKFESPEYWLIFTSLLLFGVLIPLMF